MSNPKSSLQERIHQFKGSHNIQYQDGTAADGLFTSVVTVSLDSMKWCAGSSKSHSTKKQAQSDAATVMLANQQLIRHLADPGSKTHLPTEAGMTTTSPSGVTRIGENYKTRLNELCMGRGASHAYDTTGAGVQFTSVVTIHPLHHTSVSIHGTVASSKKLAEQSVAAAALADPRVIEAICQATRATILSPVVTPSPYPG
jgi:hypothetical protein